MIFYKNYLEKARRLGVSSDFLSRIYTFDNEEGVHFIRFSNNERELYINAQANLYNSTTCHFFDFSYLLGLSFGVYNVYHFEEISSNVKRDIATMNPKIRPSREKTYHLFQDQGDAISSYLSKEYLYPVDAIYQRMEAMFQVQNRNPYFDDEITTSLGKMVTGYYLYIHHNESMEDVDSFFRRGEALTYFESQNKIQNFKK